MTEENNIVENTTSEEAQEQPQGINISMEQILAAVLHTTGKVEVSLQDLVKNYSDLSVKVDQDPETQALTFSLEKIEESEIESEPVSE